MGRSVPPLKLKMALLPAAPLVTDGVVTVPPRRFTMPLPPATRAMFTPSAPEMLMRRRARNVEDAGAASPTINAPWFAATLVVVIVPPEAFRSPFAPPKEESTIFWPDVVIEPPVTLRTAEPVRETGSQPPVVTVPDVQRHSAVASRPGRPARARLTVSVPPSMISTPELPPVLPATMLGAAVLVALMVPPTIRITGGVRSGADGDLADVRGVRGVDGTGDAERAILHGRRAGIGIGAREFQRARADFVEAEAGAADHAADS